MQVSKAFTMHPLSGLTISAVIHHFSVMDIDRIDHDMRMIIVAVTIGLMCTIERLVGIVKKASASRVYS